MGKGRPPIIPQFQISRNVPGCCRYKTVTASLIASTCEIVARVATVACEFIDMLMCRVNRCRFGTTNIWCGDLKITAVFAALAYRLRRSGHLTSNSITGIRFQRGYI